MLTLRVPTLGLLFGACAAAIVAVPVASGLADQPTSAVADPCAGGVNIDILSEGVPINACAPQVAPPVTSGGAPTQETLTACSGIPGCLSNVLYGPGNVVVPDRDTRVRHSQ